MTLNAVLTPVPEGGFRAFNPETQLTSHGETAQEAMEALKRSIQRFLEETPGHAVYWSIVTSLEIERDYTPSSCPL